MAAKPKPKPKHQGVADRARHDRAFLKKALANPGLRAKLPSSMLPANLRQQRETSVRLATPIVPGSSMTERDLANAAQAATTTRYGPQERSLTEQQGIAQQTQRDTGSFYDQYLAQLAQHAANVAGFQQGAQQGMAQVAQGITGLAGSEGAALQQQANQTATPGVAPAGNLAPMASDAAAIRQAMIGSFQAQQAMEGAATNSYADAQARVVGPGQKLSAQAQAAGRTRDVGKQIQGLRDEEGAFNQQFRDTRRQDEFKNVLAQQTLGANIAQDQAQTAIAATKAASDADKARADAAAKSPAGVSATSAARAEGSTAAKYGYSVHDWRMLGPTGRSRVIAKSKTKGKGPDVITSGAFAGYTKTQVAKLDPARKQQLIDAYNKAVHPGKKPKAGEPGAGPDWKNTGAQSTARSQVVSLRDYANKAKSGQAFVAGHAAQPRMSRAQAAAKIKQSVAAPADPILLTAALDAAYDGRLSRATVRALIAAGYKPSLIMSALGVRSGPTPRPSRNSRPAANAGAAVPGLGDTVNR